MVGEELDSCRPGNELLLKSLKCHWAFMHSSQLVIYLLVDLRSGFVSAKNLSGQWDSEKVNISRQCLSFN